MTGLTAFIYHKDYLKYFFGKDHPFQPIREKITLDLLRSLGVFLDPKAKVFRPKLAKEKDLLLVHTKRYVEFVKEKSRKGFGFLDYGDTPATKGIYKGACIRVGGTLLGADLIMKGKVKHAFNPGGGLHHALPDRAAGFCVFNDIAITVRYLQRNYDIKKVAIVDIDGHHADGTQIIFYSEPVLKISFHRKGIFPGTGEINEIGEDKGNGYSVNIPLPEGTFDEAYLHAFRQIVPPLIKAYSPEIIITQFGVDAHFQDPLVGLALTTKAYQEIARIMHELAHKVCDGKLLIVGGGGYNIENTARCWAVMFINISGVKINGKKYEELLDKTQPKKTGEILKKVKEITKEVKNLIFPFYGIAGFYS